MQLWGAVGRGGARGGGRRGRVCPAVTRVTASAAPRGPLHRPLAAGTRPAGPRGGGRGAAAGPSVLCLTGPRANGSFYCRVCLKANCGLLSGREVVSRGFHARFPDGEGSVSSYSWGGAGRGGGRLRAVSAPVPGQIFADIFSPLVSLFNFLTVFDMQKFKIWMQHNLSIFSFIACTFAL